VHGIPVVRMVALPHAKKGEEMDAALKAEDANLLSDFTDKDKKKK
jgi:hypothetical protein